MNIASRFTIALLTLGLMSGAALAASKAEIDQGLTDARSEFSELHSLHANLLADAAGALVFPTVTKAGFGIGGEYGEGALLVGGETVDYYNMASASVGFRYGLAQHTRVILFMSEAALDSFTNSDGWSIGADANLTVVSESAGAAYASQLQNQAVLVFAFGSEGLLGDLSLAGTKVSRIEK